jgi:Lon protease-like protein
MLIPLFPLHTVLAPGIALPLHIFEERYRVMVRRCLDASAPFGVVLIREGSEVAPQAGTQELSIAGVGTLAEIREASRYADGRWDVLAVGVTRFVVRKVRADVEPYLVADVDPYPDEPGVESDDDIEALAGRVTRRFVDYLRLLQPRDGESAEPIDVQMEVETEVDEIDDVDGIRDIGESADDDDADDADDVGADFADEPRRAWARDLDDVQLRESEPVPVPVDDPEAARVALRIPDDPSALSYLLTGIVQVEPDRKQALLEAAGAADRLRDLDALLDRELVLLGARLAPFAVDRRAVAGSAN